MMGRKGGSEKLRWWVFFSANCLDTKKITPEIGVDDPICRIAFFFSVGLNYTTQRRFLRTFCWLFVFLNRFFGVHRNGQTFCYPDGAWDPETLTNIFQRVLLLNPKGWCPKGTPYHPFGSTPWKIQEYIHFFGVLKCAFCVHNSWLHPTKKADKEK